MWHTERLVLMTLWIQASLLESRYVTPHIGMIDTSFRSSSRESVNGVINDISSGSAQPENTSSNIEIVFAVSKFVGGDNGDFTDTQFYTDSLRREDTRHLTSEAITSRTKRYPSDQNWSTASETVFNFSTKESKMIELTTPSNEESYLDVIETNTFLPITTNMPPTTESNEHLWNCSGPRISLESLPLHFHRAYYYINKIKSNMKIYFVSIIILVKRSINYGSK